MKQLLFIVGILMTLSAAKAQEKIRLYPGTYFPFGKVDSIMPTLTVFRPAKNVTNTAVIICSGGSYWRRANEEEGLPACKKLAAEGITAFLLDYRLPHGRDSIPFADAQAAIRYLRKNSRKFHIDRNKVGILGFSAGGHLVSTVTTHFKENFERSVSQVSSRPDFSILIYPVISLRDSLTHRGSRNNLLGRSPVESEKNRFSNELQVSDDTPPVFIVHAIDDHEVKIDNTLLFIAALRQHQIPVETFIYAEGGHGFGINNSTAKVQWTVACIEWIKKFK